MAKRCALQSWTLTTMMARPGSKLFAGWQPDWPTSFGAEGFRPILFRSGGGNGIHIWLAWEKPQSARDVRHALQSIVSRAGLEKRNSLVFQKNTVEIFPKQDEVDAGRYGNLIALPLSRKSAALSEGDLNPIGKEEFTPPAESKIDSPPVVTAPSGSPEPRLRFLAGYLATKSRFKALFKFILSGDHDIYMWIRIGLILKAELGDAGFSYWNEWSKGAEDKYPGEEILAKRWATFPPKASIGIGTLFYLAQQRG